VQVPGEEGLGEQRQRFELHQVHLAAEAFEEGLGQADDLQNRL
jgi:hypothetical protein